MVLSALQNLCDAFLFFCLVFVSVDVVVVVDDDAFQSLWIEMKNKIWIMFS